jgi:hypothetical protein
MCAMLEQHLDHTARPSHASDHELAPAPDGGTGAFSSSRSFALPRAACWLKVTSLALASSSSAAHAAFDSLVSSAFLMASLRATELRASIALCSSIFGCLSLLLICCFARASVLASTKPVASSIATRRSVFRDARHHFQGRHLAGRELPK